MIAKIDYQNKSFYSRVFALFTTADDVSYAVVFDSEQNAFRMVKINASKYLSKLNVNVVDNDTEGFIDKDEIALPAFTADYCSGYDWLLNDINLLQAIAEGRAVDAKYIALAQSFNASIDIGGWRYVTERKDADELLTVAGGFHDSYLTDVNITLGKNADNTTTILLNFQTPYGFDLVLAFEGETAAHYSFSPHSGYVYSASVLFGDKFVYFAEDNGEDEINLSDLDENDGYFYGERLKWKIVDKS